MSDLTLTSCKSLQSTEDWLLLELYECLLPKKSSLKLDYSAVIADPKQSFGIDK